MRIEGPILDWLSFTLPAGQEWMDRVVGLYGEPLIQGRPYLQYEESAKTEKGVLIAWNTDPIGGKIYVSLSSKALAEYGDRADAAGMISDVLGLCPMSGSLPYRHRPLRITRMDIAIDDRTESRRSGLLEVGRCFKSLENESVVTGMRRWNLLRSGMIYPFREIGETLYLGLPGSTGLIRIYDKEKQVMVMEGPDAEPTGRWVRFEYAAGRERADALARALVRGHSMTEHIYAVCDFKTADGPERRYRRDTVQWWSRFLGAVDKNRVCVPKEMRGLEDVDRWIERQAAQGLAAIYDGFGPGRMYELIKAGRERMEAGGRMREILDDYRTRREYGRSKRDAETAGQLSPDGFGDFQAGEDLFRGLGGIEAL